MESKTISKRKALEIFLAYMEQLQRMQGEGEYGMPRKLLLQGMIYDVQAMLDGKHGDMSDDSFPLFAALR
jgi:hypothetical protein